MKFRILILILLITSFSHCKNTEEESSEINHQGEIIIGESLILVSTSVSIPQGSTLLVINHSDSPIDLSSQSEANGFDYDDLAEDQRFSINVPANSFGILDLSDFDPGEYHFYSQTWQNALTPSNGIIEIE